MIWAFWALCHTLLYGSANQMNRYWQLPGRVLVRWRSMIPAAFMLPVAFWIPPPLDPVFYIAVTISGLMVLLHDGRMYDVSAKYGAQVTFRLRALMLPIVFFVWLALKPAQIDVLLHAPLMAGGIVACMGLIVFFMMRLGRCHVTRAAFRDMLPVIACGVVFDITNKTAMDHASFPANTLYYVFFVSGLPMVLAYLTAGKKRGKLLADMAAMARQGLTVGFVIVFSMVTRNLAMMATPNPAYVTAVSLTAPFWIMLWMKLRGEKEEADWKNGSALVLSVLALVLLAAEIR
jgi:hypothetical protein